MERVRYAIAPTSELRNLCIKNNWFTAGTCSQYEKLFELNQQPVNVKDIALVIWLCSDEVDMNEIFDKLVDAKADYHERIYGGK